MIIAVIRLALAWLARAGYDVPQIPSLRVRQTYLEKLLMPEPAATTPRPRP